MIHFDTEKVWVAPFYYVMQMYNKYGKSTFSERERMIYFVEWATNMMLI